MIFFFAVSALICALVFHFSQRGSKDHGALKLSESKEGLFAVEDGQRKIQQRTVRSYKILASFVAAWLIGSFALSFGQFPHYDIPQHEAGDDPLNFDWEKLHPIPELHYVKCYEIHQCARLEVPLDYNATNPHGPKAAIAVIKKPAAVPVNDSRYGGAVLTNPGGPGGSGVGFHVLAGQYMSTFLDSGPDTEEEKYFDVIGFDPRGIGFTTPATRGLDHTLTRNTWLYEDAAVGYSLKDKEIFDKVWARSLMYGQIVADQIPQESKGASSTGAFVTTAIVVQDMVEIIEAHGRWRERERLRISNAHTEEEIQTAIAQAGYIPGEEQLNFWGISYGTVIGQTFATLQPHRVGRVLLDGVVDIQDHIDTIFIKNLVDVEKITTKFAKSCIEAGSEYCSIASWGGPKGDIDHLVSKVYSTITDLKKDPITYFIEESDGVHPVVITYTTAMSLMFLLWYGPVVGFKQLATFIKAVADRDMKALRFPVPVQACPVANSPDPSAAGLAVLCSDARSMLNMTRPKFQKWLSQLQEQSPLFSDRMAPVQLPCNAFDPPQPSDHDVWKYQGPFGAKTANPILFASQRYDPVTPLQNAEAAAEHLFPGAGVLEITDGAGHSTMAWPSACGANTIREYFRTGKIPGNGKKIKCKVSIDAWKNLNNAEALSDIEAQSIDAMSEMGERWRSMGWGLGHRFDRTATELINGMRIADANRKGCAS